MRLSQRSIHWFDLKMLKMFVFVLIVAVSAQVAAEGTYQTGANQDLFVDDHNNRAVTELKLYIHELGDVINIAAGSNSGNAISVTIVNPAGTIVVDNVELTAGDGLIGGSDSLPECPLTDNTFQYVTGDDLTDTADDPGTFSTAEGTYTISFEVDGNNNVGDATVDPYDITVTAATDEAVFPCALDADGDGFIDQNPTQEYKGGRLHSSVWSFNGNGYLNTTEADFYVLVPGGRDWENYTWLLDLSGLGGYYYEIAGNITGVDSPNGDGVAVAGFSVPWDPNSYTAMFDLYLAYPEEAYPPGEPPAVTNFRFYDDDAVDNSISPGNQDTVQDAGNFIFESDVEGTYAIFIDGDNDGIYDPTTTDDILLSGVATVGENTVFFDGNDNTGNPMQVGVHMAMISLRAGEYHFVGSDIEYCLPGIRILDANDPLSVEPALMFWNDTLLEPNTTSFAITETYPDGLTSGEYSDGSIIGVNAHSWGANDSNSEGNEVYIDTYVFGKSDTAFLEVVVTDDTDANISSSTMTVTFGGTGTPRPGDTLTYTITLINTSTTADATDVSLSDAIPVGTTYVVGSMTTDSSTGTLTPGDATMATDLTVPQATDADTPGITVLTFNVTIDPGLGRTISTQSTFSYDNDQVTGLTDGDDSTPEPDTTNIDIANDAPVVDDDTFTISTTDTVSLDILDGDSDVDSGGLDTTSVVIVTGPTNGTAVYNEDTGMVEYTPTGGTAQDDSFTYTVVDLEGGISDIATVTIVVDSDGDGLSDDDEINIYLTDPNDADSDDDGLSDGDEINTTSTDPNDADSDDDGLSDGDEINTTSTDPNDADSDDDGLSDGDEINTTSTDPNDADSDDDGLSDGDEINTTSTDPNDADSDDDGLSDGDEINTTSTDPNDSDSDDDGLSDGDEVNTHTTDPNDADSDDDGLSDGDEINTTSTDPNDADSDDDGLSDGDEVNTTSTDPNDADSDDDGLSDGDEVNTYLTDPNDSDTDDGGVDDGTEVITDGTDPLDGSDDVITVITDTDSDTSTDTDSATSTDTDSDSDSGSADTDSDTSTEATGTVDRDSDGVADDEDNCPTEPNRTQDDLDHDGTGDVCDLDRDGDDIPNQADNCPTMYNPGQKDMDGNDMGDACQGEEFTYSGSTACSCSTVGAAPTDATGAKAIFLMALVIITVLLRRKWVAVLAVFAFGLVATTASAQDATVNTQAFTPSPFMNDLYNVQKGNTLRDNDYRWNAGLYLNYQNDPLVLRSSDDEVVRRVVQHQVSADILLAISLMKWLDVGLAVPMHVYQDGEGYAGGDSPNTFSVGDVRLHVKARLLQSKNGVASLAFAPYVTFPTGQLIDSFSGSAGVTFVPQLVYDMSWKRAGFALNAGYRFVKNDRLANLQLSDELLLRFGTWLWFVPKKFSAIAEISTATRARSPFAEIEETPTEVIGGLRIFPADWIHLNLGGGMGITQGYGSPDFRVLAGVVFTHIKEEPLPPAPEPVPEGPKDSDGDGLLDPDDVCPNEPEDRDNYEDMDGCPDPDNDKDGVLDVDDECPIEPEDRDNFEDEDGCLEPDNDMDGVLDAADECPIDPEDKDDFEDTDGCPDLDNDQDRIWDKDDQCPNEPETINGKDDEDGCPDSKAKVEGKKIIILDKIYFHYNKTKIMKKSFEVLDDVVDVMKNYPQIQLIEVEGHTDTRGKAKYNKKLSAGRAKAVRQYLVDQGIDAGRVQSVGKGESEPLVSPEETDEDFEKNRRVEFEILRMEKTENVEIRNAE